MMHSKEQIEALRNDPFVRLMSFLLNDPEALDKAINEVEKEDNTKEVENYKHEDHKTDAPDITPIVNKDAYDALVNQVFLYKKNISDLHELGINLDPSVGRCSNHPLLNMIALLLTSIWNSDFTSSFINLLFDDKACKENFEELYKMYCE